MADIQTVSIDPSKIKVRWEEPYVSAAANRFLTTVPRGVYRGGYARPMAAPSTSFRISKEWGGVSGIHEDTFFVYFDAANAYSVGIREDADVVFNMSSRFTAGGGGNEIPPGGEVWWVWADADYNVSSLTAADWHVTLDPDVPPDGAIVFGKITMVAGQTQIDGSSTFDRSVITRPIPTPREDGVPVAGDQTWGMLDNDQAWRIPTTDQKKGLTFSISPGQSNPFVTRSELGTLENKVHGQPTAVAKVLVSGNQFQLSGWYQVGGDPPPLVKLYFSMRDSTDPRFPALDPATSDALEFTVYNSSNTAPLDPSTDPGVDSDGFYQNPWIRLNVTITGALFVYCYVKSTLELLNPWSFPVAGSDKFPAVDQVSGKDIAGSPDSLSGGLLGTQLASLLGFTNARIKTINPVTGPISTAQLLWRSHNATLDASVTKETVSIYFLDGALIIINGGYIDASGDVYAGTGSSAINVTATVFAASSVATGTGMTTAIKLAPVAGSDWTFVGGWDETYSLADSRALFQNQIKLALTAHIQGDDPASASKFAKLYESGILIGSFGDAKARMYYGNVDNNYPTFWITLNAYYDNSAEDWVQDEIGYPSLGICFGYDITEGADGIWLCRSDPGSINWDTDPTDWGSSLLFGTSSTEGVVSAAYNCGVGHGAMYERCGYYLFANNPRGSIDGSPRGVRQALQFRNKWDTAPTVVAATPTGGAGFGAPVSGVIFGVGNWACYVSGNTNPVLGPGLSASQTGYVDVY